MLEPSRRRDFIKGLLACGCLACGSNSMAVGQERKRRFCMDAGGSGRAASVSLNDFSRDELVAYLKAVVTHIQREDAFLSKFFEFPSAIYLEPEGRDAHAQRGPENPDGSRQAGSTTLGLRFLQIFAPQLTSEQFPISGILAHEKSHVYQYFRRLDWMLANLRGQEVKYVELHADYLSGAYMAWRQKSFPTKAGELSQLFYNLGDRAIDSPDHHGTHDERFKAYANGYYEFLTLKEKGMAENVETAAKMGMLYVRKMLSLS